MISARVLMRNVASILHPVHIPVRTQHEDLLPSTLGLLTEKMPVVIIHFGKARYLRQALRQAENAGNEVILIGDESNNSFAKRHFYASDYFQQADAFRTKYRHLSLNPYNSELACFLRWFILKEFMEVNDLSMVFVCDSDVMLYSDVNVLPQEDAAFASPVYVRAGQSGTWRNAQASEGFWAYSDVCRVCQIIENAYEDRDELAILESLFADLKARGSQGGVSDMLLLGRFAEEKGIQEGVRITDRQCLCHNINDSEGLFEMQDVWPSPIARALASLTSFLRRHHLQTIEYVVSYVTQPHRVKAIEWREGLPYGTLRDSGDVVRLHSLHFAGRAKRLISRFQSAAQRSRRQTSVAQ